MIFRCASKYLYSNNPKTGRPVFGYFHLCPVVESSGCLKTGRYIRFSGRPVHSLYNVRILYVRFQIDQNRFGTGFGLKTGTKTGFEQVCRYNCPNVRNPDVISGFQTTPIARTYENRMLYPVFRRYIYITSENRI